jgi:hypothetical protein
MQLNFDFKLKGLDGQELSGNNAGQVLASMLAMQNKGNSIKLFDWAMKLYNNQTLEIDETDCDVLLALIESTEQLTILAKVPMINYIKSVKKK